MLLKDDFSRSPIIWGGTRKIRAISSSWNFLVSRNCACSGEMEMGVYFIPSSSTATLIGVPGSAKCPLPAFPHPAGIFNRPRMFQHPEGAAPLAKNFAPYSSQAMAMPMAFFAIAIGE